jgi:hypothetical protein
MEIREATFDCHATLFPQSEQIPEKSPPKKPAG